VFFDQVMVRMTTGKLKEEAHYYPHGLPMAGMGSAANGYIPNRNKYQSNEYNKEQGLNWMDFHNRQYDPQLGRFLSIDPLAAATVSLSPYTGMNNDPVSMVDPLGLQGIDHAATPDRVHAAPIPGTGNVQMSYPTKNAPMGSLSASQLMRLIRGESMASVMGWNSNSAQGGSKLEMQTGGDPSIDYSMIDYDNYGPITGIAADVSGKSVTPQVDKSGGLNLGDINSMFGNGTFIASNALAFAETKAGRVLSMGGAFVFKTSSYSLQKAMVNPVIGRFMGKEITTLTGIKGAGKVLGVAGLFFTGADMIQNGVNTSNTMDATFGVFSFVPGVGWVVGGAYFIGNAVSTGLTGKNIGQHVDDFVKPQNLDNMADDIIHFYSN
jgi:RHS repeat-associated protein